MALPGFLISQTDGVTLAVKVQPRASRNEIGEAMGEELKIRVTAPPVDAAANEAVLRLLAEVLGCPRGAVSLLRGATSRRKTIFVRGLKAEGVLEKLRCDRHFFKSRGK